MLERGFVSRNDHSGTVGEVPALASKSVSKAVLMLSLHLLQVSLVYINTLMIQQVLEEEAWKGWLTAIDLRALSPLKWQHINPYDTFTLNMLHRSRSKVPWRHSRITCRFFRLR
jgi:hypothetical protein